MTFDFKKYKREWMRRKRAKQSSGKLLRKDQLLAKGFCPMCEIRLDSKFHFDCPYLHTHIDGQQSV